LYNDLTRECAEKFEDVINISNFDVCDSDRFKECPFYRILNEPEKLCKYVYKCVQDEFIWKEPFERIIWVSNNYCLSENKINCERYKLMKAGKTVPKKLLADGSKIELEVGK
jgi:hypothetical protein